jgi:hypothetical protein
MKISLKKKPTQSIVRKLRANQTQGMSIQATTKTLHTFKETIESEI